MKFARHLALGFACLAALTGTAQAQNADFKVYPNSPAYEAEAMPLRNAVPGEYRFTEARLSDALQLLADEAGISFFSLPADSDIGNRLVTFTIRSSPFLAMETLAKANGVALIFENGIWYLRPENDTHLIGRVYEIQYNPRERITATNTGGNLGSTEQLSSGATSTTTSSLDLQGTTQGFEIEPSELLEDIRELLDISPGVTPYIAGATSVDALNAGTGLATSLALPSSNGVAIAGVPAGQDNGQSSKVIWNSDSNTLYVVATRQQHSWIEGYLAAADKPQDQIAIEVKFFETSRDPSVELGLDWTGTLSNGYDINLTGNDPDVPGIAGRINLNEPTDPFELPTTAILSFEDVNVKLRALVNDLETKTVSYPRMVTTNNREVVLRSVVNQPVLAGTSSTSLGTGATTNESIAYLPIGTVLNILPKKLGNGKVQLNVALTISSIIGNQIIAGNPYPVATSRVYQAPIEIEPGFTVAIGGLDEASWDQQEDAVPALSRIPVVGYAFKSRFSRRERKSLMIMITPAVIDTRDGGLPDKPQSVTKQRPDRPQPPVIYPDGTLVQGPHELEDALVRLRAEIAILNAVVEEANVEKQDRENLFRLYTATQKTQAKLKRWSKANRESAGHFGFYRDQFATAEDKLGEIQRKARWMIY